MAANKCVLLFNVLRKLCGMQKPSDYQHLEWQHLVCQFRTVVGHLNEER